MKESPHLLEAIGITVETFRKKRTMTKIALADFAQLQDCYVRGITKGRKNPTISVIFTLCEALEISLEEFFKQVDIELNKLK